MTMTHTSYTDFEDNNFLQDWLENRYGSGFAQVVMDDLECRDTEPLKPPFEVSNQDAVNDNHAHKTKRRVS